MRKITLALTLFLVLISCSSSDDSSTTNSSINPPAWIQGTWMQNFEEGGSSGIGYKFSNDNICSIISTTQTCFKETLGSYTTAGVKATFDESIKTDTEYKFSLTVQSVTTELYFKKGNANTIYLVSNNINSPLKKQ